MIVANIKLRTESKRLKAKLAIFLFALVALLYLAPAIRAQEQWHIEVVDDGSGHDVGSFTALAIDHDGDLHIGYNQTKNILRYAYRGAHDKQWYKMAVDFQGGTFISLVVDSNDRPHFAYNSLFLSGLHYAYWDGTRWTKQVIDATRTNHMTSIGIDASGHPRISYYQEETPEGHYALLLKYAYFDGKTWYVKTLDHHITRGKFSSIAVDQSGNPHIAYSDQGIGDLRYTYFDGLAWDNGVPDSHRTENSYVGIGNSIALDSSGNPMIAYFDMSKRTVKLARWTGKIWETEVVDQLVDVPSFADRVSLKLDSQNAPHVAFYDGGLGALKYAEKDDKGWHTDVVDNQGKVGLYPSLALDQNNQPYISYYDASAGQLKLAYRESKAAASVAVTTKP
jgi:hypothetical protein